MEIRFATIKDINLILSIDNHINKEELTNLINLKRAYLIEVDQKFIGYMRYNLFWDNTPFLNMIYLLEDHRRKGYGAKLINFFEQEMKKQGYFQILTSTLSNEEAKYFYRNLGYKDIGGFTLPNEPEEIILLKTL